MSDDDTLRLTPAEVEQVEAMLTHDARDSRYWAAIRADQSRFTVDAVIRLADNEQAELLATIDRVRALAEQWRKEHRDMGFITGESPRPKDYSEGHWMGVLKSYRERADDLDAALGES